MGRFFGALLVAALPGTAIAQGPIASSNFVGFEDPLSENGAWAALRAMASQGTQFQKNFGAYPDTSKGDHAGARTTAAIPADHYSEIVVGQVANTDSYVGPFVRVQTSSPPTDAGYLWWGSLAGAPDNFVYRIESDGTHYKATALASHSPLANGDRLRLIARGPVIYGVKNGVRDFIYNTGMDLVRYSGGTAGMLAQVPADATRLTDATISSWSGGAAPVSSGTWASSTFAGTENPLDEGDRWYPLPGQVVVPPGYVVQYKGFRKAGGLAIGLDPKHNVSGVWSIAPPATQYSEVTLGTVASGGGGPVVRIDRTNPGQTGWLLFISADNPTQSAILKLTPSGMFTRVLTFAATVVAGDKWRLTAEGNLLTVSQNGVALFTYTTDGSYPDGDVGIDAFTPAFTFAGWEGGDTAGGTSPTITGFTPTSGPAGTSVAISGTNFTGATAVAFNGMSASFTVASDTAIEATVPAGATTGPLSVTTPGGTPTSTSNFTVQETLTAANAGTGSGTITADPGQINCGATCSDSYAYGTVVRLTATPATGSDFTGWSGCDAVSGATCTVSMNAPRSVTATFTLQTFTLGVSKARLLVGDGTVTSSSNPATPNQINCGPTCSASYGYGTVVTLTATPGFLSAFASWNGCDAVSGATCTVTMSAARSVTAVFLP
jgi:hypothetical protein